MSKQTPRRYGGGWWIKVEDYEAGTAALKAENARLREKLDMRKDKYISELIAALDQTQWHGMFDADGRTGVE